MVWVGRRASAVEAAGDPETAAVLQGILADEVHHVRFANRWIKAFVEQDRRVLLKVAFAVRFLERANAALQSQPGETNAAGRAMDAPSERAPALNVAHRHLSRVRHCD